MFEQAFYSISQFFAKRSGVVRNQLNSFNYQYLVDRPAWLSLTNPHDYRQAVASNPVLYGCIDILASAAANGRKYLVDLKGKEVSWDNGKTGVKQARRLFVDRPNPLQCVKEYDYERAFMYYTFGNNYVYLNNASNLDTDIMTVQTMFNLPSEWVEVKQTGKIYNQVDIKGIIEKYCLTNYDPVRDFDPSKIIHFNDINTSSIGNAIMGSSRLETLKYPITNTQLAFEAMNVILKSRGMQGIIKANNKDATGTQIPLNIAAKKEIDDTFKKEYGVLDDQKQFLISYSDIDFIRTIMSSAELGIYDEFSNNAMIISNGLRVPPGLYKTYMKGETYANQAQDVKNLYQNTVIPRVETDDQYYTERLKLRDYGLELKTDFSHVEALQEARKEKATSIAMNSRTAESAYNNNLITWNEYRELLEMEPVGSEGDVYKYERDEETRPESADTGQTDAGTDQEDQGVETETTQTTD
jgi:phage portal protein BeeE